MNIVPSFEEFKKYSKHANLIPVYTEIFADMETPVSAYKKLEEEFSFLLESVEGGERIARYSFLGTKPAFLFKAEGKRVEIIRDGKSEEYIPKNDPLEILKEIMQNYKVVRLSNLPRFTGGAVGYISYDTVRFFEKLPSKNEDDLKIPDIFLLFTETILIFDHVKHTIIVVSNVSVKKDIKKSYNDAIKKINEIVLKLRKPLEDDLVQSSLSKIRKGQSDTIKLSSNLTKLDFKKMVLKAKEYIRNGDIIQVVLSQRLSLKLDIDTFNVYRALRVINPSPYMYYLKFGDLKIIGASPELFVRIEDGIATIRPIAGTRKRGRDFKEDERLMKDLLEDPKEKAEHIMLVDLARNDLGRVCKYGSVNVNELMVIEKYSHVMHIVSDVSGKLLNGVDVFDVIRAAFPAGTVSGAPKIRAMEIIEELENIRRGPYAGLIGYFSFSGNLDSCITIRTIIVNKDKIYIQAGAGIVADSKPEREYYESLNKAKALISAINLAKRGFYDISNR